MRDGRMYGAIRTERAGGVEDRRILHVCQPSEAGVAHVVLDLARHQATRGLDVAVACDARGWLGRRLRDEGVTVLDWPARRSPVRGLVGEWSRLRTVLATWRPDVVHLHSAKAGLVGRVALRGSVRTVFQPHAWSFEAVEGPVRTAARAWEAFARRWSDATICVSAAEADLGREIGADVVVVPNGVDLERWNTGAVEAPSPPHPAPGFTVVCVGRLCRQKGQDVLVAAWQAVRTDLPAGSRLVLVGDGPDEDRLHASGATDVELVGPSTDPREWYAAADLVVVPSRWEGAALVLLEAMAMERPVLATAVGSAPELAPALALVPPDDVPALADRLVALAADAPARAELARRARKLVTEQYDLHRLLDHATAVALGTGVRR